VGAGRLRDPHHGLHLLSFHDRHAAFVQVSEQLYLGPYRQVPVPDCRRTGSIGNYKTFVRLRYGTNAHIFWKNSCFDMRILPKNKVKSFFLKQSCRYANFDANSLKS
jgi:hypothetical protein